MAPAAVGAAFVAMGASAATGAAVAAVVSAVYVGAAYGAVIGAATAAVTGGDVLQGAVKGAVVGGVSGGLLKGVGLATSGGAAAAESGATSVGEVGISAGEAATGAAAGEIEAGTGLVAEQAVSQGATQAGTQAATQAATQSTGILSKVGSWIEANPTQAALVGQGLAGAAKGISSAQEKKDELRAQLERDKLQIASQKVGGLSNLNLKAKLPTISKFSETPTWQMGDLGILEKRTA